MKSRLVVCALWLFMLLLTAGGAKADSPGGVGIQVVPLPNGELVVVQVVVGSAAARGGIQPGDLLVRIDNLDLRGSDFTRVAQTVLPGKNGSTLELFWQRPGETGTRSARLVRQPIDPQQVPPSAVPTAGSR